MKKKKITATDLARNLSDILNRARYRGEEFVVERNGEAVATLGPPPIPKGITFRELVELIRRLRPDPEFFDDLQEIHALQGQMEPSRWPD
jgi:antitoxin (DNA-binding transcriptional repressor) of toxin-antitoxin stability system